MRPLAALAVNPVIALVTVLVLHEVQARPVRSSGDLAWALLAALLLAGATGAVPLLAGVLWRRSRRMAGAAWTILLVAAAVLMLVQSLSW